MENHSDNFDTPIMLKISQLVGIVLRLFGFVIVGAFLSRSLLSVIIGTDLADSEKFIFELEDGLEARFLLLLMQAFNALFVYFALPLIYIFVFQKDLKHIFLIKKKKLGSFILLSFFIFLTALPLISHLISFNQQIQLPEPFSELQQKLLTMEEHAKKVTQTMVFYDSWYEIIPILFVVAVLAGIGEELLFRGIVQNEICGILKNPHFAIWISALLFSFIHFQFQGFLPRVALGALFGYLYYWSGSLLVPIFIHFVNNALTFTLVNYARHGEGFEDTSPSLVVTLIATIVCLSLLITCYRLSQKLKIRNRGFGQKQYT
jgi:membrane protease YdiL (CAAX protease family)